MLYKGGNNMKKYLILAAVLLMLTGCGKKDEIIKSAGPDDSNNDIISEEDMAIVEISDSSEFEDELGIKIDSTILSEDATLSILNGKIGEISFVVTNVNGGDTLCVLRMTKDADSVKGLSGYKDSEIKDPYTVSVESGSGLVDLECGYVEAEGVTVYTFELNGTYYAYNIGEGLSQMTISSMLDALFFAIE
jgi:hypothetical protein